MGVAAVSVIQGKVVGAGVGFSRAASASQSSASEMFWNFKLAGDYWQ